MSKFESLDNIKSGWDEFDRPSSGEHFRHYKGGVYEVVTTGFIEETEAPAVVYRSLEKDIVWVRTAADFFEQIEVDGERRPRFIRESS